MLPVQPGYIFQRGQSGITSHAVMRVRPAMIEITKMINDVGDILSQGGQIRVGLEDNVSLRKGVLASNNAEMVGMAVYLVH